ncbi:MAG TPA: ABC transporter substrate-binding protein [Burkholderiaceae bacterium]|jgi:branched-chain amino acid transport system substrate-binding protein|nr:ABC transporter substrate-binding protein [Burkholderiaceae bacterium]
MRLKKICAAFAACGLAFGMSAASAQKLSDDKIVIGFVTDMSSLYSDIDGPGGVEAIRMAIADMQKEFPGKKIEVVFADHQNKADIASAKVREWIDQGGADVIIGGTNSSTALASAKIAAEKKRPYIQVGAASSRLTNEDCTPYTVHYAYDTIALANGTGAAVVKSGGKSWFFLTADYAFGHSLEKDTGDVVKANGGNVVGAVRHPLSASDFSSFLLQAQNSKAQILGLANAGGDTINSIKAANEFGITKNMKLAGLLMFINDIHSLGLPTTQGMYLTDGWYWNQSPETRAWAQKFFGKMKRMPSMLQAGDYSAVTQYLMAVKAAGTDDADAVMAQLKKQKINDMFAKNGYIREDGRMIHEMYLMQVKTPAESKEPWDYFKVVQKIPGEQAYQPLAQSKCSLVKK